MNTRGDNMSQENESTTPGSVIRRIAPVEQPPTLPEQLNTEADTQPYQTYDQWEAAGDTERTDPSTTEGVLEQPTSETDTQPYDWTQHEDQSRGINRTSIPEATIEPTREEKTEMIRDRIEGQFIRKRPNLAKNDPENFAMDVGTCADYLANTLGEIKQALSDSPQANEILVDITKEYLDIMAAYSDIDSTTSSQEASKYIADQLITMATMQSSGPEMLESKIDDHIDKLVSQANESLAKIQTSESDTQPVEPVQPTRQNTSGGGFFSKLNPFR